jgi:hypothetical protein
MGHGRGIVAEPLEKQNNMTYLPLMKPVMALWRVIATMLSALSAMTFLPHVVFGQEDVSPRTVLIASGKETAKPSVRITAPPDRQAYPLPIANAPEAAHIRQLIRRLAAIDKLDCTPPYHLSNFAFAPLPGFEGDGPDLIHRNDEPPQTHPRDSFTELVRLGPRALPFLLEAIDDPTPTHFYIEPGSITTIEFGTELWGNPTNAREKAALAGFVTVPPFHNLSPSPDSPTWYTVTIGDVCYMILGQIVGRHYKPVLYHYNPTYGDTAGNPPIMISSPVHNPSIARAVRAIWSPKVSGERTGENGTGTDGQAAIAQNLLDSLLFDYATQSVKSNFEHVDNASLTSGLQVGAAMRLLYYFPKQSAALIARRLESQTKAIEQAVGLDRIAADAAAAVSDRTNCVAVDFVKAVSWSPVPRIRAVMHSVFQHSSDGDMLLAALPGLDHTRDWPLVSRKLYDLFSNSPQYSQYRDFDILQVLLAFGGEKALPLFRTYLKGGKPANYADRLDTVCQVLRETSGEWDRVLLVPLLGDRRPMSGYTHQIKWGSDKFVPIRICDKVAEAICTHRKDIKFRMTGTASDLDQQIRRLQARLKAVP